MKYLQDNNQISPGH